MLCQSRAKPHKEEINLFDTHKPAAPFAFAEAGVPSSQQVCSPCSPTLTQLWGSQGFVLMSSDTSDIPQSPSALPGALLAPSCLPGSLSQSQQETRWKLQAQTLYPASKMPVSHWTTSSDFLHHQNPCLWKAKRSSTNIPAANLCSGYKTVLFLHSLGVF